MPLLPPGSLLLSCIPQSASCEALLAVTRQVRGVAGFTGMRRGVPCREAGFVGMRRAVLRGVVGFAGMRGAMPHGVAGVVDMRWAVP